MTLHVFNPEHDIALASNLANFTAPRAGRQLRADLGWLPALWAERGDAVVVDDVERAKMDCRESLKHDVGEDICFVTAEEAFRQTDIDSIDVWGWDKALKAFLMRKGAGEALLPTDDYLERVRMLSHRRMAALLLPRLQVEGTVGEAHECRTQEAVEQLMREYGRVVLKAPWSSSGRGVRFVDCGNSHPGIEKWVDNVVGRQGSVMVEPQYDRVSDFGMEFWSDGCGGIRYAGLSLFHTANGAYVGNILATEQQKREMIGHYIAMELLDGVREEIVANLDLDDYCGPFGIDMMVTSGADGKYLLHPCVEINMRRTMGHVAFALSPADGDMKGVMRIDFNGNYRLTVTERRLFCDMLH